MLIVDRLKPHIKGFTTYTPALLYALIKLIFLLKCLLDLKHLQMYMNLGWFSTGYSMQ